MKSFTDNSIKNMIFDSGVVYFNIPALDITAFLDGTKTFAQVFLDANKLGATSGGNTLAITQEYRQLEVDGKFGYVKGMTVLDFADAELTVNLKELSAANIAKVLNNGTGATIVGDYNQISLKECLEASDYISNVVLVANRYCNGTDPEYVLVVLENVINTNGLEMALEDSNEPTVEVIFTSHKTTNNKAAQVKIYTLIPA